MSNQTFQHFLKLCPSRAQKHISPLSNPIISNTFSNGIQLPSNSNNQVSLYRSVKDIPKEFWEQTNTIPSFNDAFLQPDYLYALESNPPKGMSFAYLIFSRNSVYLGLAALQIQFFNAADSLRFNDELSPIKKRLKTWLASKVKFNTMVCGSLLTSGAHSFVFDETKINQTQFNDLLVHSLELACKELKKQGTRINSIFIKDFFQSQEFKNFKFVEFSVEPNMLMPLQDNWNNFDDYIECLNSKHRTRAKRAFKKLGDQVIKKEFNEERIQAHLPQINALYKEVADGASFNLFTLNEQYWLSLKKEMGEKFKLYGYFLEGKLIAFYTTILNDHELDAHFLGYSKELNQEHQIYLNILFDLVKHGIGTPSVTSISFARTAPEIKSSVGAVAHEMFLYLRNENSIWNKMLPMILPFLNPRLEWLPRNPFK
jgi:predicted N-acyltransferase